MRNLIIWIEKWISIWQLVPVLFRDFRSTGSLSTRCLHTACLTLTTSLKQAVNNYLTARCNIDITMLSHSCVVNLATVWCSHTLVTNCLTACSKLVPTTWYKQSEHNLSSVCEHTCYILFASLQQLVCVFTRVVQCCTTRLYTSCTLWVGPHSETTLGKHGQTFSIRRSSFFCACLINSNCLLYQWRTSCNNCSSRSRTFSLYSMK